MNEQQAAQPSLLRKIVVSYFYVAIWIFLSCSVIVFNKYILDINLYNWPYPIRSALGGNERAKSTVASYCAVQVHPKGATSSELQAKWNVLQKLSLHVVMAA